jgi:murein DD-endopeptidase MepM/ murein hydrolase activator NlpD
MRRLIALVAVLVLSASLGVTAPARADAQYDAIQVKLADTRKKLAQAEAREAALRKDMAATDAERKAVRAQIGDLNDQLAAEEDDLAAAEGKLGLIQQELDAKTDELQASTVLLEAARSALRERAVRLYKQGPATLLGFLFGAFDYHDFVTRLQLVTHIFSSDDQRVRDFKDAQQRVAQEQADIAALRAQMAGEVSVVQSQRDHVASVRGALQARDDTLAGQMQDAAGSLQDVQAAKAQYLAQLKDLQNQSNAIAAFLKGHTGGKSTVSAGGMIWPVQGPITSPFGWRISPIYGTKEFHTGIDIAANSGTPIVAAAAGTVIFVGPKGGYGNVVIVDHGGGIATLYAHQSRIATGNGAKLARGQTLGYVGCTGMCTGPHLHFEVRVDGTPQDPMRWLP